MEIAEVNFSIIKKITESLKFLITLEVVLYTALKRDLIVFSSSSFSFLMERHFYNKRLDHQS